MHISGISDDENEGPLSLPEDIQSLKILATDLFRRYRNANQAQRAQEKALRIAQTSLQTTKKEYDEVQRLLRLECIRSRSLERKIIREKEEKAYRDTAAKTAAFHMELRMSAIDRKTGNSATKETLIKIKRKLESAERVQQSRMDLLDSFAEIEKKTEALCKAAYEGDLVSCRSLVEAGAEVNEFDGSDTPPLLYAVRGGCNDIVRFLLERGSDPTSYLPKVSPIERAVAADNLEAVELLLDFGASVEDGGIGGRPPIVTAAAGGSISCLNLLLERGARFDSTDLAGNTALHAAVASGLKNPAEIIRLLLAHGIDKYVKNFAGETAVNLSLRSLNMNAIEAIGARSSVSIEDE